MASLTYSPIDICGAQFNRLDCDGNVLNGPTDSVITCGLTEITRTPVKTDDVESTDSNGRGGICARRIRKGKITHYEIKVVLCSATDADLMELLGIYERVVDPNTGVAIGIRPKCEDHCDCCVPNDSCDDGGVSIILWHTAVCGNNQRVVGFDCVAETFAKVTFDAASVEVTRNGEFNTYTITGRTDENPNWGQGPGDIYPDPAGLSCHYAEFLTNTTFPGGCNCGACDGSTSGYTP
jgi:hypothetical protein